MARRSWRRRIFLVLTEPDTSIWSAVFFSILIVVIALSNIIMIMQTMDSFQFVPTDCISCGGTISYMFEDDEVNLETEPPGVSCVCPPSPLPWTNQTLDMLILFLTVEWILRVLLYVPADPSPTVAGQAIQWLNFLTDYTTLLDALSVFPYYLEHLPNGLVSLRIFRLLRIFQLVRLGQYNQMFNSLTNVMSRSTQYLKLLMIVLAFGAAFFGSMAYWMEKGTWKYYEPSGEYIFVRTALDGRTEEPTPFTSIPAGMCIRSCRTCSAKHIQRMLFLTVVLVSSLCLAFWWFIVTATTVGYGDTFPTSTAGKYVGAAAMMMGVLVIAFPVSVFSELWSQELRDLKGFDHIADTAVSDNKNATDSLSDKIGVVGDDEAVVQGDEHGHVVLDQADMQEILECLDIIREREQRIRVLLQRPSNT